MKERIIQQTKDLLNNTNIQFNSIETNSFTYNKLLRELRTNAFNFTQEKDNQCQQLITIVKPLAMKEYKVNQKARDEKQQQELFRYM